MGRHKIFKKVTYNKHMHSHAYFNTTSQMMKRERQRELREGKKMSERGIRRK